ncbi:GGDEF domain-containing protein [Actinoplanes nipponensis]|uniref:GGDEF domain-containing protein n=1 Tax=Actinoplanes nipponensis TaxID=135950 RepID=UPI0019432EB6|nr:GGDEF domain-containing protein [Actinoplanes nipponensis]
MTRPRTEAWLVYLALGGVAAVVIAFGDHRWSVWAATALQVSTGLVVVAGILRHRPARPAFWVVTAAALIAYAVAQCSWRTGDDGWETVIPFGGIDDWLLYLAFGLFTAALAICALRGQPAGNRRTDAIDGLVVVLGVSAASWHFIAEPFLAIGGLDPWHSALFWFYELFELARIALIALILMAATARGSAQRLVLTGMSLPIAGDILFTYAATTEAPIPVQWFDLLWLWGPVTIAATALHPAMAAPVRPGRPTDTVSGARLVIFVLLTAVIPIVTGLDDITGAAAPAGRTVEGAWIQMTLGVSVAILLVLRLGMLSAVAQRRSRALEEALRLQQALREQLEYRATHDPLTGLGNRAALLDALDCTLSRPVGSRGWLILLDLDGFKNVNDTFGHPVGDALLVALAREFTVAVPGAGSVARLGGDEFAIVLPEHDAPAVTRLADRILAVAARRRRIEGAVIKVSASLGLLPLDVVADTASALREADIALYAAKDAGRDRYRVGATGTAGAGVPVDSRPAAGTRIS